MSYLCWHAVLNIRSVIEKKKKKINSRRVSTRGDSGDNCKKLSHELTEQLFSRSMFAN